MPELGYGRTLLQRMYLLSEITYEEIDRWANCPPKIEVPRWEREAMVLAKKSHENMQYKARERHCPSPLLSEEEANLAVADSMWASAKGMTQ